MDCLYALSTVFRPLSAHDFHLATDLCLTVLAFILLSISLFVSLKGLFFYQISAVFAWLGAFDLLPPSRSRANRESIVTKPTPSLFLDRKNLIR